MNRNIWVTSDTHYGHRNITGPKVSRWSSGYRDFKDVPEMNAHIVKQINKVVKEDDLLYHLGDWSFGGIEEIWNFRKQLRCKNIILLLGNHDEHILENKKLPNCWWTTTEEQVKYSDGTYSRDIQENLLSVTDIQTHRSAYAKDLFTIVDKQLEVKHGKHQFFMSHYPHLSWHHASKGVIMLHGHEHGHLDHLNKDVKRLDVGIDTAKKLLGEYRPFSIEEIITINANKGVNMLGHHQ